ncbi:HEPN domain-containing protein [Gordonia sp. N1V]|uniref:HEPN domain-containing protein n=1 Tax=Gordonia sp. N1V TaxID=3034163 RepID=UPI0023E2B5EA|nr:HEPN domain-containing protein [Gordonia sp. N1V]MDF3285476.1 HEPN domain-containing protein [Gordonia sp. N1V]
MTATPETHDGPVEALYEDYCVLRDDLSTRSPSGLAALNRSYHKVLLIAAASSLESQVKKYLAAAFEEKGGGILAAFLEKRVLARNYHTMFDWQKEKAKPFFSSFGQDCGKNFAAQIRSNPDFAEQHSAFMRIGSLRNGLVHQDYATFSLEYTPEDLIKMYRLAREFPNNFERLIFEEVAVADV